jgi:hypothetical protein
VRDEPSPSPPWSLAEAHHCVYEDQRRRDATSGDVKDLSAKVTREKG